MNDIAVVFDVDGTLVKSEHLDAKYFVQALKDVAGDIYISDDWSCYKKVTDVGIMTEILEQNGYRDFGNVISKIRERFGKLLADFFASGGDCIPVDGAQTFLAQLREAGFARGIATGGWGHTAVLKLDRAKVDIRGMPMSTSDHGTERTEIMLHCKAQLGCENSTMIYIGDGAWDRDASAELGWNFIGIGKKMKGKCEYWFQDFSDAGAVMEVIRHFGFAQ